MPLAVPRDRWTVNLFDYARYGLDNLIHVARNPSVARADEPELLVRGLRRSPGPRSAADATGHAVPGRQRSGTRSASESRAHAKRAIAADGGARPKSPWHGVAGFSAITEAWNSAVYACDLAPADR